MLAQPFFLGYNPFNRFPPCETFTTKIRIETKRLFRLHPWRIAKII